MDLGVSWKEPQTAPASARRQKGWGSPEAQAQSEPQTRSLLLSVPFSPPCSPPITRSRVFKVFSAQRKMATD